MKNNQQLKTNHSENFWHCILKVFSGRFALTVICGVAFLKLCFCLCDLLVEKSNELTMNDINSISNTVLIIISNVITFYFTREKYNGQNELDNTNKR